MRLLEIGNTVLYSDRKNHRVRKVKLIDYWRLAFPLSYIAEDVDTGDKIVVYDCEPVFPLEQVERAEQDANKLEQVRIY